MLQFKELIESHLEIIDKKIEINRDNKIIKNKEKKYQYFSKCSEKISEINFLNKEELEKEIQEARRKNKNYFNFKHKIFNEEIKD